MMHPLAIYAVQAHMADLVAEAESNRHAKQARQARAAGLVASLLSAARTVNRSNGTQRATNPA